MTRYLTRRQVASEYPISYSTLAHMAMNGEGPPYAIIGKKAVYARRDIERWIIGLRRDPGLHRERRRRRTRH